MSSHNDPQQWSNADQCYWCFLIGSEVPQGHPVWLRDASSDDSAVVQPSSSSKFGISWHQSWSFFQFFRSQMGKEDLQLVLLTSREPLQSSTASGRTAILSTQGGKGKSGSAVSLSHWAATRLRSTLREAIWDREAVKLVHCYSWKKKCKGSCWPTEAPTNTAQTCTDYTMIIPLGPRFCTKVIWPATPTSGKTSVITCWALRAEPQ